MKKNALFICLVSLGFAACTHDHTGTTNHAVMCVCQKDTSHVSFLLGNPKPDTARVYYQDTCNKVGAANGYDTCFISMEVL